MQEQKIIPQKTLNTLKIKLEQVHIVSCVSCVIIQDVVY